MKELEFIQATFEAIAPFVREKHAGRNSLSIARKEGANDLLTEVDLEVQNRIVSQIKQHFPGDAIVAEEEGMHTLPESTDVRAWFIDPIDGTQNFLRGLFPEFGVSLAFAQGGKAQAAGVAMPVSGDLFLAERGRGATRNGRPAKVSKVDRLNVARIDIDFGYPHQRDETLARCSAVLRIAGQVRCHCAAVVGLCSVACGEADAYSSIETRPWDSAAGVLLVEEAGGTVTSFANEVVDPFNMATSILVSNGLIHDEVLRNFRPD